MRGPSTSASPPASFLSFAYDLGRRRATGALRAASGDTLLLREGAVLVSERDALGRQTAATLSRIASLPPSDWTFEPGPVAADGRSLPLVVWLRRHVESTLDLDLAAQITKGLAGARLCLRPGRAPDLASLDAADRLIVSALARPRDLRELASVSRAPRFRVLALVHLLGSVGGLVVLRAPAPARLPVEIPPG